ncbi:MAG: hypothetical protein KDB58_07550 [Solirubrobacterales bacterium]|nr:hypothetical protein [Solirubrobacterales bacterium]MCB8969996.1 hypothetical protein [Thermoleophilales bacterium]MCO5327736.1 hypothetical protein [Solirubrobacterales bacterium]
MLRRRASRNSCQRLRMAVEAMPEHAREAMLRGIDDNTIIVGAYTDSSTGGICPMLAAHRSGGRTDLASFARSWDRYTDARRPRLATPREVRTLRSLLVGSLAYDGAEGSLAQAAARIRAERDRMPRLAAPQPAPAAEPVSPPERPGMLIRIRRLNPLRRRRESAGIA